MKKIISRENKPNEQESVSDPSGKNVLVVYFSVTGNTKAIAEKCDYTEIVILLHR